jgi:hypothetical protein
MLPYLRANRHGRLFQGYVRQAMLILFECLCAKPQSFQCLDSDYTPPIDRLEPLLQSAIHHEVRA